MPISHAVSFRHGRSDGIITVGFKEWHNHQYQYPVIVPPPPCFAAYDFNQRIIDGMKTDCTCYERLHKGIYYATDDIRRVTTADCA